MSVFILPPRRTRDAGSPPTGRRETRTRRSPTCACSPVRGSRSRTETRTGCPPAGSPVGEAGVVPDLLGALLGALLPLLGLGLLVDARPHLVGDLPDLGLLVVAPGVDVAHMLLHAIEVRGARVPEAPVVGEPACPIADVDLLGIVLAEVGDREQVLDVLEVLVVDLPDLVSVQVPLAIG